MECNWNSTKGNLYALISLFLWMGKITSFIATTAFYNNVTNDVVYI